MNSVFEFFKSTFFLTRLWQSGRRGGLHLVTLLLLLSCLQPAFATPTTPTGDFINNRDGTVTHKTTGLMWMRCALGQTWTGSSCSGTASTYTYDQAVALKRSFAGHSDWRLPNIAELQTVVERENFGPAMNTIIFPNAPQNWFRSSSSYVGNSSDKWIVYFGDGSSGYTSDGDYGAVRLVRGGQPFGSLPLTTPTIDFINNGNGTVTHKRTGLTWQRCAVGQAWSGSSCSGTASAYTYDQALALTSTFAGHSDWRIPNANELLSIVEYGAYSPAINSIVFPNVPNSPNDWFWSSSPDTYTGSFMSIVYFYDGDFGISYPSNNGATRFVRGGQSFASLPFSITQSPLSGSPGELFVQWGNGFSPNTTATLHVKKPDGSEYPTQKQAIDSKGHFGINYQIPAGKPAGIYSWWVVDGKTGKKSATIRYQVTPLTHVARINGKLHSNASNGAALSGAKVSTGIVSTTTASDGSFSLAKIPAGQQVINFSKSGYQSFSVTIPVPGSGSYAMGDRWLVQNGLVKPTIAQAPMSGLPGTTFVQWGTGFTPNGSATLHFKKPDNTEYPPVTLSLDAIGHLETPYRTPMDKPAGVYKWWAVDNKTHKVSNTVAYTVTTAVNSCKAPVDNYALLKISDATCREKWNLAIFYKERYNGYFAKNQKLMDVFIHGALDTNTALSIGLDFYSAMNSIQTISTLSGKDPLALAGIGVNQILQEEAKATNSKMTDIWQGLFGSWLESAATGNPIPVIQQSVITSFGTMNNLLTTIGVTALTKKFQELEIAKQYLFEYYRNGSRMSLLAAHYGLPATANTTTIIKAVAKQIGAKPDWYSGAAYNIYNVVDIIRSEETIVSMKQTEYSK